MNGNIMTDNPSIAPEVEPDTSQQPTVESIEATSNLANAKANELLEEVKTVIAPEEFDDTPLTAEQRTPLSEEEAVQKAALENIVEEATSTFIRTVGNALIEYRNRRLYRVEFATWGACLDSGKFNVNKRTAYKYITDAEYAMNMRALGIVPLANEGQSRVPTGAFPGDPISQGEVTVGAQQQSNNTGKKLTAEAVAAQVPIVKVSQAKKATKQSVKAFTDAQEALKAAELAKNEEAIALAKQLEEAARIATNQAVDTQRALEKAASDAKDAAAKKREDNWDAKTWQEQRTSVLLSCEKALDKLEQSPRVDAVLDLLDKVLGRGTVDFLKKELTPEVKANMRTMAKTLLVVAGEDAKPATPKAPKVPKVKPAEETQVAA